MIRLSNIQKSFGATKVVDDVSCSVDQGQLAVLFGPSGCGKSTLLRMIAGLEEPDDGRVEIAGRPVAGPGLQHVRPELRNVGLVFQDLALFPHLTVTRNIEFGLVDSANREDRTKQMLALTRLESLKDRLPHELSGGEQQRVAVARALAPAPDLLLLDEPFANLDAELRNTVRLELVDILRNVGTTAIMVTHDREEALSTAELLLVMSKGRLLQSGKPKDLYEHPGTPESALLLGEGNFIECIVQEGRGTCCLGEFDATGRTDGPCRMFIRSEHLALCESEGIQGCVEGGAYYGHDSVAHVRCEDGALVQARQPHGRMPQPGSRVGVRIDGPFTLFDAG